MARNHDHRRGEIFRGELFASMLSATLFAWSILMVLEMAGCSLFFFFDSPLDHERQALKHTQRALDQAQRLIPLLQVQDWERAFKRTARVRAELETAIMKLDRALKGFARQGQSPLGYELNALELIEEVLERNRYIQEKLKGEITTSTQNRLIEKARENAKDLERAVSKLERAIERRSQPEEGT